MHTNPPLMHIVTDPVSDAVINANKWVVAAEPIIKAWLAIDQIHGDLNVAFYEQQQWRYADEAAGYLAQPMKCLFGMLEGIRDDFLCDMRCPYPQDTSGGDKGWDFAEEWNDRLERETIHVADAIRRVSND